MGLLLNLYWLCLGVGGLYILIAGSLGVIGAGGHSTDAGAGHADAGFAHDAGHMAGGHDASGDSAEAASSEEGGGGEHGLVITGQNAHGGHEGDLAHASPLNLLNLMCFLASFGGTGLALLASNFPHLLSFPVALAGGLVITALFHFLVARVLYRMQGGSAPTQYDMLGLEAEVLTPLEPGKFGEIAYTLGGARFTAPAKLLRGERAGRTDSVRIVRVEGNTVYVEPRRKLLE